ncbi:MAG: type II toxin-antitoxin system VapC family toxin [Imperialibacter sp.]|uniref:type II toxin-antitoxin system VapC family toxin n=1 Tax=Imperialibacter sp. TaxID=2038411 RepID=UPI0032EBC916
MILLDSSVIIEHFRKKNKQETMFYSVAKSTKSLCISAISYYEIGIGNRKTHSDFWHSLTQELTVLPFDQACADIAVSIYRELLRKNKMIDIADLLIGATAVAHALPIATLNVKHFERINDLEVIS